MISIEILTEQGAIESVTPECIQLAKSEGAVLPFQYMQMPLTWWKTFHSGKDALFSQARGKNFLGIQSHLEKFFVLIARKNGKLCGVVPLVQYSVKTSAEQENQQIIALAGDYVLHPFQDFVIDHTARKQIMSAMLEHLAILVKKQSSIFWAGYLPEDSPNLDDLRDTCNSLQAQNIVSFEAISSQRGGIWPWTISGITATLDKMKTACEEKGIYIEGLAELSKKFADCTPQALLFPRTRTQYLQEIKDKLLFLRQHQDLSTLVTELEAHLVNAPILYPYIELPETHDEYLATLSYSTRRYFRRYMKKYFEAGGSFEIVAPDKITKKDIEDYIQLHLLRWGNNSAAICGKAADYHRIISKSMANLGLFQLFFARYHNQRIAVHSCFDIGRRREGYVTGVDSEFEELRAGRLLYIQTIYDAIDKGLKTYELGIIGFDYKMSFVQKTAVAHNFFICPADQDIRLEQVFTGFECMEPCSF